MCCRVVIGCRTVPQARRNCRVAIPRFRSLGDQRGTAERDQEKNYAKIPQNSTAKSLPASKTRHTILPPESRPWESWKGSTVWVRRLLSTLFSLPVVLLKPVRLVIRVIGKPESRSGHTCRAWGL